MVDISAGLMLGSEGSGRGHDKSNANRLPSKKVTVIAPFVSLENLWFFGGASRSTAVRFCSLSEATVLRKHESVVMQKKP